MAFCNIVDTTSSKDIDPKENRISFGINSIYYHNVILQTGTTFPNDYFQLSFRRYLDQHFLVHLDYACSREAIFPYNSRIFTTLEKSWTDTSSIGELESRHTYHYAAFGVGIEQGFGNNRISIFAGPAFAYGENRYKESISVLYRFYNGNIYPHLVIGKYKYIYEFYWGAFAAISYDYLFLKGRVNVGADVYGRYYNDGFPLSLKYGFHVGYNF